MSTQRVWDEHIPTVNLEHLFYMEVVTIERAQSPLYLMDVLVPMYWSGVVLMAFLTLFHLYKLWTAMRSTDEYRSFSFFSKIILGRKLAENHIVRDHERVHVKQGHSYDLMLMELMCIFNWFNPVLYLYRKELKFQHECIADEICSGDKVAYAQLLVAHALRTDVPLAHEFSNQSFLKKRIMMLFRHKSRAKHKYLYLAVIPAILVVALSTLIFNTSKAKDLLEEVTFKIQDVAFPLVAPENKVAEVSMRDDGIMERITAQSKALADTSKKNLANDASHIIGPYPKVDRQEFHKWIMRNYQLPKEAIEANASGMIKLFFMVEADGRLSEMKVLKDFGYGSGETAMAILKKSEKWNPATTRNGRPIRFPFVYSIQIGSGQDDLSAKKEVSTEQEQLKIVRKLREEEIRKALEEKGMDPYPSKFNYVMAEPLVTWDKYVSVLNGDLQKVSGSVDKDSKINVELKVDEKGDVSEALVLSMLSDRFLGVLKNAIEKSKWKPGSVNGVNRPSKIKIEFEAMESGELSSAYALGYELL